MPATTLTYNAKNVTLQQINRELYPKVAQKIDLSFPSDGTNTVYVDLQELWDNYQFSANGIIVDLSRVGFFSPVNPPLAINTFNGGGILGSGMTNPYANNSAHVSQGYRLGIITPSGQHYFCDCRDITEIPLNGVRTGILTIQLAPLSDVNAASAIDGPVPLFPMSVEPNGDEVNTISAPISFTVTLVNVPIKYSKLSTQRETLASVFDSDLDEGGTAAVDIGMQDFEGGQIIRPKVTVNVPQRIVTFQGNDTAGPFCAPESPRVSRFSASGMVADSTIPSLNIINGAYNPPNKPLQHLTINAIRLFLSKLLLPSVGEYVFSIWLTCPGGTDTYYVEICSFSFFWVGQDDFDFSKDVERYVNILDMLAVHRLTVRPPNPDFNELSAAPYLEAYCLPLGSNAPANISAGYHLEVLSTLLEDQPINVGLSPP